MTLQLQNTLESDLPYLYAIQADEQALSMAAFTSEDSTNKEAYVTKWTRLLSVNTVHIKTILYHGRIVGCVARFIMNNEADITYAIDKKYWGKGIATEAVAQFLTVEKTRPLYGRTAFDNIGSQRVLEKNGFRYLKDNIDFALARKRQIKEFIYQLT